MDDLIIWIILFLVVIFLSALCVKPVGEGQIGIIERLGVFHSVKEVGLHFIMPFIERMIIIKKDHTLIFEEEIKVNGIPRFNLQMKLEYLIMDVKQYRYLNKQVVKLIEETTLKEVRGFLERHLKQTDLELKIDLSDYLNERLTKNKWGISIKNIEILTLREI